MPLHEVEMKALIAEEGKDLDKELDEARIRLLEIGVLEAGTIQQKDVYLSHPCRDFSRTDEAFRIRTQWEIDKGEIRTLMTYKGPKVSERSKARIEREVEITGSSSSEIMELFNGLGFSKVPAVEKVREHYKLEDMEISLDLVTGLGLYIEVEVGSDDVEKAEDRIFEVLKMLGWTDLERRSYLELLLSS
jgi:adenylate cyclase class 2